MNLNVKVHKVMNKSQAQPGKDKKISKIIYV